MHMCAEEWIHIQLYIYIQLDYIAVCIFNIHLYLYTRHIHADILYMYNCTTMGLSQNREAHSIRPCLCPGRQRVAAHPGRAATGGTSAAS